MRKNIVLMALLLVLMPISATGQDVVLTAEIREVVLALDRNGRQYVRVIVSEERTLNGIAYQVGVPVMAFGRQVEKAKILKKGQILKAICKKREFHGEVSYTILTIVP